MDLNDATGKKSEQIEVQELPEVNSMDLKLDEKIV